MQITFELSALSEADVRGLQGLLSIRLSELGSSSPLPSISEAPQPAVGENTGSTQSDATPSSGDAAVTEGAVPRTDAAPSAPVPDAAPTKRGPGRPKKANVVAQDEPGLALESGEFIPAAEIKPAAAPTADDLRAALQKLTSAKGIPAGIDLLKSFDCQRISEMAAKDAETQAKFIAACEVA